MTSFTVFVGRIVPSSMASHVGHGCTLQRVEGFADGVDGTRNLISQAAIIIVRFGIIPSVEARIRCTLAIGLIDSYYQTYGNQLRSFGQDGCVHLADQSLRT